MYYLILFWFVTRYVWCRCNQPFKDCIMHYAHDRHDAWMQPGRVTHQCCIQAPCRSYGVDILLKGRHDAPMQHQWVTRWGCIGAWWRQMSSFSDMPSLRVKALCCPYRVKHTSYQLLEQVGPGFYLQLWKPPQTQAPCTSCTSKPTLIDSSWAGTVFSSFFYRFFLYLYVFCTNGGLYSPCTSLFLYM